MRLGQAYRDRGCHVQPRLAVLVSSASTRVSKPIKITQLKRTMPWNDTVTATSHSPCLSGTGSIAVMAPPACSPPHIYTQPRRCSLSCAAFSPPLHCPPSRARCPLRGTGQYGVQAWTGCTARSWGAWLAAPLFSAAGASSRCA